MLITTLMPVPKQQYFGIAGLPLIGGKIYTYAAGTNNPKPTYTDAAGTIAQPNPIPLNARGEPASPVYWSGAYKVEVRDAIGNLIYTVDNYNSDPNGIAKLFTSVGTSLIGFIQSGLGAVMRSTQDKLRDTVSVYDFGAVGDGQADDTAAIQLAFTACAAAGKVPIFDIGQFKVTQPIDTKGLPLYGRDRLYSTVLCNVGSGKRTFEKVGQVVNRLHFKGPGGGAKPDAFSVDGYKRYITENYFEQLGDAICSTAIFVTTVVSQNEFITCESAINDKLQDGTNAHTTLWFTDNNVLYSSKAFDMRTEAAGFVVERNVFENLYVVYEGNGKQIFGSIFAGNWVEQMDRSVTLFSHTYAGGTNEFRSNQLRPGAYSILDIKKWSAAQFTYVGDAAGGGGGVATDASGSRFCDFNGNGVIVDPSGIKPSAATANYANAADITLATQNANVNQSSRGGDLVIATGLGSNGGAKGALRTADDYGTDLGRQANRWGKAWIGYLKGSGAGGFAAPTASFHELNNNQLNGITLATYSADTGPFTVCHQSEFAAPAGSVNGSGYLYFGKNNGGITYQVLANGNVRNVNNSYGAISDAKLKENVTDATPKLADLLRVRIVNYNLIADPEVKQLGVIAQELEQVFPGMVEETQDFVMVERKRDIPACLDDDGNEVEPARTETYLEAEATGTYTKSVKYSVFIPMVIKALQELKAEFDAAQHK